MIAAIVLWIYIFSLFYLYGQAALTGLKRILGIVASALELPLVLIAGMTVITVLAMIVNLFFPLGAGFAVALLLGALVIFWRGQLLAPVNFPSSRSTLISILAVLVFLTILENTTHVPSNPDTGLYHAQTIRWFETYHIVPGLGNFQPRFAFNSSWLVLNASLSFAFLGLRSFRLVNGALFLIAMLYFSEGVKQITQRKFSTLSFIKALCIPLSFYLVVSDVSSVGNDMPVSLVTWMILISWLERFEISGDTKISDVVIFILSFFCVTVKLSSLFLLIFPFMISIEYLREGGWRKVFILAGVGGVILLPWVIRSAFLSGYLVFPVSQVDVLPVDWKMPKTQLEKSTADIIGIARLGVDWGNSDKMSGLQWVPKWYNRETNNRKMIYLFILFTPVLMLVNWFNPVPRISRIYLLTYGIALIGSLLWFVSAPDIRFGYGFLLGAGVLALAPILVSVTSWLDKDIQRVHVLILLALIAFQAFTLWRSIEVRTLSSRWWLPADYRSSVVDACSINGAEVYCPRKGLKCNYDAFPCLPFYRVVEMRGDTFQDGFRASSAP